MSPAGVEEVERAKTQGRWQAAYQGRPILMSLPTLLRPSLTTLRRPRCSGTSAPKPLRDSLQS